MEPRTWKWTDAHFCSLPSQTSIYGCTEIKNIDNSSNKLLVASLVGRFFSIDYQRVFDKLTPSTKEIQFTYIPGESEIVSVDATNQCCHGKGLTIGITFWKVEENESKQFLHLYFSAQLGEEFNVESVAQGCQSLELSFMPYQLTHTELHKGKGDATETVFLLGGSDKKIHMYREMNTQHGFKEVDSEEFFPEFRDLPSVVLWSDMKYYNKDQCRISVTGHQDGVLRVSVVDVQSLEILNRYSVEFDNPITYVQVFTLSNKVPKPSCLPPKEDIDEESEEETPELNILVLSALIPATVYRDVLNNGLKDPLFLPDSHKFDAVLTGCILDIDFDGENEILIGTYGQEVLAYKLHADTSTPKHQRTSAPDTEHEPCEQITTSKPRHKSGETEHTSLSRLEYSSSRRVKSQENLSTSVGSDTEYIPLSCSKDTVISNPLSSVRSRHSVMGESVESSCQLLWQRSFPCPVMGINRLDIMGDGMEDLVIVTLKGLHILQPDLNEVAEVCLERLRLLAEESQDSAAGTEIDKTAGGVSL